jgi:hypothetical protein
LSHRPGIFSVICELSVQFGRTLLPDEQVQISTAAATVIAVALINPFDLNQGKLFL